MNLADFTKLGVANPYQQRYDNFIGGKFVPPVKGEYFANLTPITGKPFCEIARSTAEDVEIALDAAHAAKDSWAKTSQTERANILNKIADRMEQNRRSGQESQLPGAGRQRLGLQADEISHPQNGTSLLTASAVIFMEGQTCKPLSCHPPRLFGSRCDSRYGSL